MPVFNGARYLADAIGSIQAQSHRRWELIAVDNQSSDDSTAVVGDVAAEDRRIRLVTGVPGGRARAANVGMELARGELIALMDQDDVAVPERFAVQLDWMARTGAQICGSWIQRFGDGDGLLWFPETHEAIGRELLFRCSLMQPSVLMHAEIMKRNRYDEAVAFDDYELWTRLVGRYRMGNVPAVLLRYRCHPQQSHIAQAEAFSRDMRRLRTPLFRSLFPDADRHDAEAIAGVADRRPFTSVAHLEHAGWWLVRLAQSPDRLLRRRMLERWRDSCRRSAHLGVHAQRSYTRLVPEFGLGESPADLGLRVACALHLDSGSRLDRGLRRVRHASRRLRHAAA